MIGIDDKQFDYWWNKSVPFIEESLKYFPTHSVSDIRESIDNGTAIFYPVKDGVAIFRCYEYPQKKVLNIWIGGGDMKSNLNAVANAAEYHAQENDCTDIIVAGRRGWERVFKPYGYNHRSVLVGKELGD
jgi:hypothetical protein